MANALNRDIEQGEVVIVRSSKFTKALPRRERAFVCSGNGFGTAPYTAGTAVFGEWYDGSGEDRIEGTWIDERETELFQKYVGRFPSNSSG